MIISTDKAFIFCAFNKTGTTSIEEVVQGFADKKAMKRVFREYQKFDQPVIFKHMRPLHVQQIIGAEEWERHYSFCFVRNPFGRMVSLYHFHRQAKQKEFPQAQLSFIEWVRAGGSGTARKLMSEFVSDADGNRMVEFVGRYENLAEDYADVAGRLGLPPDLSRSNASSHRDYREYYDDESRELVTRWVRADLEAFDYRFSD